MTVKSVVLLLLVWNVHVDDCELSGGNRESHQMLVVPSDTAVGGVDRGTMSGLVALI